MSRLVQRARITPTGSYQIRQFSTVYQVVAKPFLTSTPVYTTHSLARAKAWIDRQFQKERHP